MVRVLTPQGLRELTDAEDGDDDDDDAQQSHEEDWPPASPRVGPRIGGLGDWGRPARRTPTARPAGECSCPDDRHCSYVVSTIGQLRCDNPMSASGGGGHEGRDTRCTHADQHVVEDPHGLFRQVEKV